MMFDNIDDSNIMIYCIKAYDKPNMIMSEFEDDFKRYNYLNRLFTRYKNQGDLRERLILNHLVILNNVFTPEINVRVLFLKIYKEHYHILKTFLLFLNVMPEKVYGVNGSNIISSDIQIDMNVVSILRGLK